jgi:hypothetical protein
MKYLKYITFTSLLIISTQSLALNLAEINQPIEQGLYDNRSCNDLYMQATNLEKETFTNQAGHKRTQVAAVVSTIFTPALYYMGYSAFQDYKNEIRSNSASAQIEEIRFRMAEKRCFTK